MPSSTLYYYLKPLIPRWLQIKLRRRVVLAKYPLYKDTWPIDERAGMQQKGWQGWPDGKKFAFVITHDVETARGHEKAYRLARLDRDLGFRSCFNFVPEGYRVSETLRRDLVTHGFEVGVHGLTHSGNLYVSKDKFDKKTDRINHYLREWQSVGFRTPSMYHNLEWVHDLNVEYDASTFDTDPFEPQSDGVGTIFPFWVPRGPDNVGYVELPYTLPQDFTLYILMAEQTTGIWKAKLDWIARNGGMALLLVHPDYMHFEGKRRRTDEYPVALYRDFLEFVKTKYEGQYWHALPREVARFWKNAYCDTQPPSPSLVQTLPPRIGESIMSISSRKTVWIDLDNSPHVPFFSPIIEELEKKGYRVVLTARDCSQTCGLADLFHMKYNRIGRHYGKNKLVKVAGTVYRALQLSRVLRKDKPALAVSHGSRAQMLSAVLLGVPSVVIMDYEHVKGFINPTWIMMPEVISSGAVKFDPSRILKYSGIKEDVYVPTFEPDPAIRKQLGLEETDIVVTIRPPATEAHYHNPESEVLFSAAVNRLGGLENVRMVVVPRNESQNEWIEGLWPEFCHSGRIIIPKHVVDGLNLLWHSDLVISGGGTMNREAAALGVPVYSIFRGKIGAVDRYLAENGRLVLLESPEDVRSKLVITKRELPEKTGRLANGDALQTVVKGIVKAIEHRD